MLCTSTLHTIMSGTASRGGNTCSSTAPATAKNANPVNPDTTAPEKMPSATNSCGRSPGTIRLSSLSVGLRCGLGCIAWAG